MCQFAVTHEGGPHVSRSKLAKECVKTNKMYRLFFASVHLHLMNLSYYSYSFFYNNNRNNNFQLYNRAMTAPFHLLSCCYAAPLMVIGDSLPVVVAWLWIFAALLFGRMRSSFLFILWLKENISPFLPPSLIKSWWYFKQRPAGVVSAIICQQMFEASAG